MSTRTTHVRIAVRAALSLTLLTLALLGRTPTARAAGVVGTGAPASCTEAALDAALAGGGLVTFNCGPAPLSLLITGEKAINDDTDVDGGGLITLNGGNATRLFFVNPGTGLTLRHLTLTNGYSGTNAGGCLYNDNGTLSVSDTTLQFCQPGSDYEGGAIFNLGVLTVTDSVLQNNSAASGAAISSVGTLSLANSIVRYNSVTVAGGGLKVEGSAQISGSAIYSNTVTAGSAGGGGIYLASAEVVTISHSQIYSNTGRLLGGGIYNYDSTATLTDVTLSGNSAQSGGGIFDYATMTLTAVTLSGNSALNFGGGISASGATATLTDVTLSGNSAGIGGGGIYSYDSTATLTNVTLSGNSAQNTGGGIANFLSTSTLTNVTFSGNSAANGGGIWHYSSSAGATVTLKNTIMAHGASGGNCYVESNSSTGIDSAGFNLTSDTTCTAFTQAGDQNNTDPLLGPLANNGGPTLTHMPQAGSPAIDTGTNAGCPAADQRGAARPVNLICDKGAVEVGGLFRRAYLPLVLR